jgi:hypothetical protein
MKLWLDDIRLPPSNEWIWVKRSVDAIEILSGGFVSEVSLDHDLGVDDTGYTVAVWIEKAAYMAKIPKLVWHVHSANPVGALRIAIAMKNADSYWDSNS